MEMSFESKIKTLMLEAAKSSGGKTAAAPYSQMQPVGRLSKYPLGTGTNMSAPRIYAYIQRAAKIDIDMESTHTNTNNTNGLILLSSLAENEGGLLVEIYTYNVHPSNGWDHIPHLLSSFPWVPVSPSSWHLSTLTLHLTVCPISLGGHCKRWPGEWLPLPHGDGCPPAHGAEVLLGQHWEKLG